MAKILCMDPATSKVGWRDENSTSGFQKFTKYGDQVGAEPPPSISLAFTGEPQQVTLPRGRYRIECWGAAGGIGNGRFHPVGRGGYTSGIIVLLQETVIWVYVGMKGADFDSPDLGNSSFNGGGFFLPAGVPSHQGGNGGGATDIRLTGGAWSDIASLRSRIMVAAGGGGAGSTCGGSVNNATGAACYQTPGHGGGLVGQASFNNVPQGQECWRATGRGGTQTAGGIGNGYTGGNMTAQWNINGEFGKGADSQTCGAGAGSGYYGGASAYGVGSGGGSSFISGHAGCNAINASGVHTGQNIHYSGLYFTNTSTSMGVREGNGTAAITPLQSSGTFLTMDGPLVGWRYKEF